MAEANYPSEVEDFRVFVGAVSEIQDRPQHEAHYADEIREKHERASSAGSSPSRHSEA